MDAVARTIHRKAGEMTAKEAIETLKANYPDDCYKQLREAVDKAIKVLEVQNVSDTNIGNNNDTIYRQDAINVVKRLMGDYELSRTVQTGLHILPSAQPEQRWIPCSERLPEVEELVLVTDDSGGIKTVDVDWCGQYEDSNERFWYYTQNAVAWMPLPKPYHEGEQND